MLKLKCNKASDSEFQVAMDDHFGRGKRARYSNPRNSKVKDALAAEATRFKKFDDFARSYWDSCSRGLYWIATDEKRFYIGEHERKLISDGRFFVSCSPDLALSGKNEGKKYIAELDVTRVPASSIAVKRGTSGAQVKVVGSAGSVKVARVLESAQAKRAFRWQLSILPSSKEELRSVWEVAWEKRRKAAAIRAVKVKKEEEREAHRAASKSEKDMKAADRHHKKKIQEARGRKSAREAAGRRARKAAAGAAGESRVSAPRARASARKSKKETVTRKPPATGARKSPEDRGVGSQKALKAGKSGKSGKRGSWKRVPTPNPSDASDVTREIPSHINNPGAD